MASIPAITQATVATITLLSGFSIAADLSWNAANGRQIAYEIEKGNCLACHRIPGDPDANTRANIGPPLVAMKQRFPDRARLRAQIWDPMQFNPNTAMPPFGRHGILTEKEIELVIDFLYTI